VRRGKSLLGLAASAPAQESAEVLLSRSRFSEAVSIQEPAALGAAEQCLGAFRVLDPEREAMVAAEIKIGEITVQVGLADMMEIAIHAGLMRAKNDSTVLVWWNPPVRTYSSAEWLTVPCPANSRPSRS